MTVAPGEEEGQIIREKTPPQTIDQRTNVSLFYDSILFVFLSENKMNILEQKIDSRRYFSLGVACKGIQE